MVSSNSNMWIICQPDSCTVILSFYSKSCRSVLELDVSTFTINTDTSILSYKVRRTNCILSIQSDYSSSVCRICHILHFVYKCYTNISLFFVSISVVQINKIWSSCIFVIIFYCNSVLISTVCSIIIFFICCINTYCKISIYFNFPFDVFYSYGIFTISSWSIVSMISCIICRKSYDTVVFSCCFCFWSISKSCSCFWNISICCILCSRIIFTSYCNFRIFFVSNYRVVTSCNTVSVVDCYLTFFRSIIITIIYSCICYVNSCNLYITSGSSSPYIYFTKVVISCFIIFTSSVCSCSRV